MPNSVKNKLEEYESFFLFQWTQIIVLRSGQRHAIEINKFGCVNYKPCDGV